MHRLTHTPIWRVLVLIVGLWASVASRADPLSAVQTLRLGGCGGTLPAARPLNHNALLDRAAQQWAAPQKPGQRQTETGLRPPKVAGLNRICSIRPRIPASIATKRIVATRATGRRKETPRIAVMRPRDSAAHRRIVRMARARQRHPRMRTGRHGRVPEIAGRREA